MGGCTLAAHKNKLRGTTKLNFAIANGGLYPCRPQKQIKGDTVKMFERFSKRPAAMWLQGNAKSA